MQDKRWELEACNPAEWALWLEEQKKAASIAETNCVYVQVCRSGRLARRLQSRGRSRAGPLRTQGLQGGSHRRAHSQPKLPTPSAAASLHAPGWPWQFVWIGCCLLRSLQIQLARQSVYTWCDWVHRLWLQIQLDGSVRASGVGSPPWKLFVRDLPELSSMRTKFTDGAGVA